MARKKSATPEETPDEAVPGAEYTVLARRYRPQNFADLVGQEAIAQALGNAIKTNRVAHAYLFTGARGVGKTSTARILAKCLNCAQGPTTTPCEECELCRAIATGEDVDVLEIDGASNNKVEEIRDLRSNVQYRPQRARYKIYIIDEVHMLSNSAFNALLKTLEEPPPHVKFIFATTEVSKIPVTILSRCQRFDFAGINLTKLRERLQLIVDREGMKAEPEALELIARRAGGSMRDAQSLLDQLLAFGGDTLTVDRVHQLLGTAHEERVVGIAAAVLKRDAKQALALVAEAADRGLQLGELLDQLIEYWRDLMVVQAAGVEGQSLSVTGANRAAIEQQVGGLAADSILAGLDVLVSAKNRLRNTTHGRVVLEMALVRLARLDDLVPISQLVEWIHDGGAASSAGSKGVVAAQRPEVEKKKIASPAVAPEATVSATDDVSVLWQQIISQAGFLLKHELRNVVTQAIPGPNSLVLAIPRGYNLPDDSCRGQVEELLGKITGQKWQVKIESTADPRSSSESPGLQTRETPMQKRRRQQEEVLRLPTPARAREMLGAQVVDMDEGFGQSGGARNAADEDVEPAAFEVED